MYCNICKPCNIIAILINFLNNTAIFSMYSNILQYIVPNNIVVYGNILCKIGYGLFAAGSILSQEYKNGMAEVVVALYWITAASPTPQQDCCTRPTTLTFVAT